MLALGQKHKIRLPQTQYLSVLPETWPSERP